MDVALRSLVSPCGLAFELFVEYKDEESSIGVDEGLLFSLVIEELFVELLNDELVPPCALEFKLFVSLDLDEAELLSAESTDPEMEASLFFWGFDDPLLSELAEVDEAAPLAELVDPSEASPLAPVALFSELVPRSSLVSAVVINFLHSFLGLCFCL